jgi:membrane-bound serine protease (ClpP class)
MTEMNTTIGQPPRCLALVGLILALAGCPVLLAANAAPTSAAAGASGAGGRETATRPSNSFDRAIIIPVEDEITDITRESIKSRLDRAKTDSVPLVVFEMDTPGGALGPTLEICTMIRDLRSHSIQTYAWINKNAYSAGTIIALATQGIMMSPNATMGDCQPIMLTGMGAEAIPEGIEAKAMSPLIAELRESAREGGYPLSAVMALIRPEIQIFWVEDRKTGERRLVDIEERDALFGLETPAIEPAERDEESGKAKSANRKARREPVPDTESKTDWCYVKSDPALGEVKQPVDNEKTLLTLRDKEALAYGLSKGTVSDVAQLKSFLRITGSVEKIETSYWESFVAWLASPLVRAVLFVLMLMGAYAEFHAPGVSLPGAVALIALVLFLGAPYMAGYTVAWEILAIIVGLILIAVELFLIPGFGVAGLIGVLLLGIGMLASFVPPEPVAPDRGFRMPELPLTYDYLREGVYAMAGGLSAGLIGMMFLARYLPKVPVAGQLIAPNPEHDAVQAADPYLGVVSIGDVGRSETLLRPAGKGRFRDELVDVVSQGDYIDAGVPIKVVERYGSRVVVRRADQA